MDIPAFLPLIAETDVAEIVRYLLNPGVLIFCIPIAAILVGGLVTITKLILTHRERIAKIEMGIDPDALPKGLSDFSETPPGDE